MFRRPKTINLCATLLILCGVFPLTLYSQVSTAVVRYQAGSSALARGDSFSAVEEFSAAIMENPAYFEAHVGLA